MTTCKRQAIFLIFFSIFWAESFNLAWADPLAEANQAYAKKDFSAALTLYQSVLKNHAPQQNLPIPPQNQTLTQKVFSFFSGKNATPSAGSSGADSKNFMDGYLYLRIGECNVELNKLTDAENSFTAGASAGGNNDAGNACLFEKGCCHMRRMDYQNAYQCLKE